MCISFFSMIHSHVIFWVDKEHKHDRQVKTENWESGADATGRAKTVCFHFSSTLLCLCSFYIMSRRPTGKVAVHLYASLNSALDGHQPHYSQERSKVGPRVGVQWRGKSCHHRSSNPNRPARSQSLYWLRHSAHVLMLPEPNNSRPPVTFFKISVFVKYTIALQQIHFSLLRH